MEKVDGKEIKEGEKEEENRRKKSGGMEEITETRREGRREKGVRKGEGLRAGSWFGQIFRPGNKRLIRTNDPVFTCVWKAARCDPYSLPTSPNEGR